MRVLFIVHGFPPAERAGTENYAHDLAHVLHETHGDQVFVITRESDRTRAEFSVRRENQNGVTVLRINNTLRKILHWRDALENDGVRRAAADLIDEIQPDIAHFHHLTALSVGIVDELHERGIPALYLLNDYWLICHRGQLYDRRFQRCDGPYDGGCSNCIERGLLLRGPVARFVGRLENTPAFPGRGILRRLAVAASGLNRIGSESTAQATLERLSLMQSLARRIDRFLAPSKTMIERFREFGLPAEQIVFHDQGINQERFQSIPRTESSTLRVGFLGSLIVSKAPHLLVEAFEDIPRDKASLHIYGGHGDYHGDTEYRRQIEPLLARDYVDYRGSIPHAEIPGVLGSLDVIAITSTWIENAPFVIREAYVSGHPVIASNIGGMADLVHHEKSGLLFAVGDAADLRKQILRLADDRDLLDRLRRGLPRMKTMEEDSTWVRELYETRIAARAERR